MSKKQITAFAGDILLLAGALIPIARLNGHSITFLPVWNNLVLDNGLWNWRDISFFAVTMLLLILLTAYFTWKKNYAGLMWTGVLSLFIIVIVFMAILQINTKLTGIDEIMFSMSFLGWLILLAGSALVIYSGIKENGIKQKAMKESKIKEART